MSGGSWSRTLVIGAGALMAQAGVTATAHSQSAGSIGVRVQVVKPVEAVMPAEAVKAGRGPGGQMLEGTALRSRQPTAGHPVLVVVDSPRQERSGEVRIRRVTVVVP